MWVLYGAINLRRKCTSINGPDRLSDRFDFDAGEHFEADMIHFIAVDLLNYCNEITLRYPEACCRSSDSCLIITHLSYCLAVMRNAHFSWPVVLSNISRSLPAVRGDSLFSIASRNVSAHWGAMQSRHSDPSMARSARYFSSSSDSFLSRDKKSSLSIMQYLESVVRMPPAVSESLHGASFLSIEMSFWFSSFIYIIY